jgi:hypothetical protein
MSRPVGRTGTALFVVSAVVYLALLAYRHESVPGAPCNDIAEEALSGYLMIQDRDYVPIYTKLNPNGHESLHVLAVGALAHALGGEPLAILLPAWAATLLLLLLLFGLARAVPQVLDGAVVVPVALSCLWMFHYARTGLRAVSSPALLLLFLVLLHAAFKRRTAHPTDVLAGAALAFGTYAYTASRVVVVAFALFGALELARAWRLSRNDARRVATKLAAASAGFLVVFSWHAVGAFRDPATFFGRGTYVIRGGAAEWLANTLATLLLPVHYGEAYREALGDGHDFDAVAVALPAAGLPAIPLVVGAAFFVGLWIAARRYRDLPVVRFLLLFYLASVVALGFTGPSLTRLYVVFPVFVLLAGLAFSRLTAAFPARRPWVVLALHVLAALNLWSYFQAAGSDPAVLNAAHAAGAVGRRARELCAAGRRPLCVVSRDRNVVRYFTIGHWDELTVREFHRRPFRPPKLQHDIPRADVILVDDGPNVEGLVRQLCDDRLYREQPRRAYFREYWALSPASAPALPRGCAHRPSLVP